MKVISLFQFSLFACMTLSIIQCSHAKIDPNLTLMTFSKEDLRKHDGKDPNLPLLLAIKGKVYDVTSGRQYYGPGAAYSYFAARDASRSYITGCFREGCEEGMEGLTQEQLKSLDEWAKFYDDHHTYLLVGYTQEYYNMKQKQEL